MGASGRGATYCFDGWSDRGWVGGLGRKICGLSASVVAMEASTALVASRFATNADIFGSIIYLFDKRSVGKETRHAGHQN